MTRAKSILIATGFAAACFGTNLPVPTSAAKDFEYTSTPAFTGYTPAGATVSLFNNFILLYGSPLGANPRKVELFDIINADVCYSTACPSTTTLYPQPNYVLSLGSIVFAPYDIIPGTGVNTVDSDFAVNGALFLGPPTGEAISAHGTPVLYTGEDPGGLSSYVFFRNADGTYSNTLHVLRNTSGGASLLGVILDPAGPLTLDILGFSNPNSNSFISAPVPEPSTVQLWIAGGLILAFMRVAAPAMRRAPGRAFGNTRGRTPHRRRCSEL